MELITTTEALAEACAALATAEYVTVDTEFLRESTYWPKLCVVQMASEGTVAVVDALAPGLDLQPFFALMADTRVLKVFHSGRQDIEIVWHLARLIPQPLFDTQIAAMVCGFGDSVAYDQLARRLTGAQIDKSSRFTDWTRRPLTQKQLDYAAADVTHLRGVYEKLVEQLQRMRRTEWLAEEMAILGSSSTYETEPEKAWARLKMRVRRPREVAVLVELAAWREIEAKARDVPRSRVLKDDAIYEVATQIPRTVEALGHLRSLPKGFERSRTGADILAAVERGLARDPATLPQVARDGGGPDTSAAVELLKVLLRLTSEAEGVAAKMIATVDDLERIAAEGDADIPALKGWRRELFGERALKLRGGALALAFERGRVVTVAREPALERG